MSPPRLLLLIPTHGSTEISGLTGTIIPAAPEASPAGEGESQGEGNDCSSKKPPCMEQSWILAAPSQLDALDALPLTRGSPLGTNQLSPEPRGCRGAAIPGIALPVLSRSLAAGAGQRKTKPRN